MHLYVIRHAQSLENIYRAEVPNCGLSELGAGQAQRIPEFFKHVKLDTIFSSPFVRTIQTATPLAMAQRLPIFLAPGMAEHFVNYEGYPDKQSYRWETGEQILQRFSHVRFTKRHDPQQRWWPQFPEDEESLKERVRDFYDNELRTYWGTDKHIAVVGHGASTSALKELVCGEDQSIAPIHTNAVVFEFVVSDDGHCKQSDVHTEFLGELLGSAARS